MPNCFIDYYKTSGKHQLQAILFDVDGTIASGKRPLPNAAELIDLLKKDKFPFFLLTNDSCNSPEIKSKRLRDIGIQIQPEDIVSCAHTLKDFIREKGWQNLNFFVNGSLGKPSYADLAEINWSDNPEHIRTADAIIFGEGEYEWKFRLETIFNTLIAKPHAPCIVPNPDSYWPLSDGKGELGIGAGAQARFIFQLLREKGIEPTVFYLGKPYPTIYNHTAKILEKLIGPTLDIGKIAMVGDSLRSDIKGGNAVGMHTILVLSGITAKNQLENITPEMSPKQVFDSL